MSDIVIMIPVYNGEEFIRRSLDSCVNQTKQAPVWVVDNRSTDRTQAIVNEYVEKYPFIKLIVNDKNYGRAGNLNQCLEIFEKSPFEYIKWLYMGDELLPRCIEVFDKVFQTDSEIGAIACPEEYARLDGSVVIGALPYKDKTFSIEELRRVNLDDGGLLGAIVSNAYAKRFIQGYRFYEQYLGKADFDFEILSRCKAHYIGEALVRFNVDSHRTLPRFHDYYVEAEYAFNRAFHLEKNKAHLTKKEYRRIREKVLVEFVTRNIRNYPVGMWIRLIGLIVFGCVIQKPYVTIKALLVKVVMKRTRSN